jgi:Flp pilus assembly protein TadB
MVFTVVIVAAAGYWGWRRTRRSGYRSWYDRRWRMVERDRRRRIVRAVRQGRAVEDPRDASLAIEFIDAQRQLTEQAIGKSRWTIRLHYVLLASVALWVVVARPDLELVAISVLPLAYLLAIRFVANRLRGRVAAAREKNERLLDGFS